MSATYKVFSVSTKVILTNEDVITGTLKVISATQKLILTTEEVITATLKATSATTKANDSPVLLLETNKYLLNIVTSHIIGIGGA